MCHKAYFSNDVLWLEGRLPLWLMVSGERDSLGDADVVQNCACSYYSADPFWVHPHLPMNYIYI